MTRLGRLKPDFWDLGDGEAGPFRHLFKFRRIWELAVALAAGVALVALISMTVFDYFVTRNAFKSEILARTSRLVSDARRTVSFLLAERASALDFIVHGNTFEELNEAKRLAALLENLKKTFVGFVDLGLIDSSGRQRTYVGPYKLGGVDNSDQKWFKEVLARGVYVSDMSHGFQDATYLVTAVKRDLPDGSFYVLRATLDTEWFNNLFSRLEVSGPGDTFIINREGTLQTPSRYYGKVLEKVSLPIPHYSPKTGVYEWKKGSGEPLVVGYAYITEMLILMIVEREGELMKPWHITRKELIGFLAANVAIILLVILGVATYLVNKIYVADEKRLMTLHQMERSNKMASIGRLATAVAHEINNPLAIINEKAGLIKDIFTLRKDYTWDPKLIGLVDSVLSSVARCGAITKRLLSFARHVDVTIRPIDLKEIINEVLGFLDKEAEYRNITVSVDVSNNVPAFESDRGKLEQIFLNLVNNAFAAMNDGGKLDIKGYRRSRRSVSVKITDDGCGIPEKNLERIFDPFFSTKRRKGGTGLGLAITYGLVHEVGGKIRVESKVGRGTSFNITLPLNLKERKR
jgi:signal transduction histidine kinase